jgi:cytidyltransferase-like protein
MVVLGRKQLLGAVFAASLGGTPTVGGIAQRLGVSRRSVEADLVELRKAGLVQTRPRLGLTRRGRKAIRVVFIGGGFEVIHRGHLYTIQKAKGLGDVLVVSVARDSTIRRRKKREPVCPESARVELMSSLRQVDVAILGVEGDIYETLERVRPDMVALGYDQHHAESEISSEAKKRGMDLEVVRLDSPYPDMKTSSLLADF